MPVFDITDGQGNLEPIAPALVFSRMLFPRDEELIAIWRGPSSFLL